MRKNFSKTVVWAMVLCVVAIFTAYRLTIRNKIEEVPETEEKSVEIYQPVITAEPEENSDFITEPVFYYLQSEDNMLVLYEVDGNIHKVIKSTEINMQIFPYEDRELLKNGIKAFTLEEGIEIMENFIS